MCSSDFMVVAVTSSVALRVFICSEVIVDECLESLSVITLKHQLELLPTFVVVIRLVKLNVKGVQVIKGPYIEAFPVL